MPSPATEAPDDLRRVCVVAGTQHYGAGFEELRHVPKELALVRSVLMEAGMEVAAEVGLDPEVPDFQRAVRRSTAGRPDEGEPPPDAALVYYSGHGFRDGADFRLAAADGSEDDPATSFSAFELARLVLTEGPAEVVVVVDACYSGEAVDAFGTLRGRIDQERLGGPDLYLITSSTRVDPADQMVFAEAFAAALRAPGVPHNTRYISPQELVREINERMSGTGQSAGLLQPVTPKRCRVFPNPRHSSRGLLRPAEASPGTGWVFCGRRRAVGEVVEYLRGTDPDDLPLLVSGAGGSGKSILLTWVAAASAGRPLPAADEDPGRRVPPGCVDVFVDAKNQEAFDVLSRIGERLGIPFEEDDCRSVVTALERRPGTTRILIDSVDRACEPLELAEQVLVPLARIPSVRLVVAATAPLGTLATHEIPLDAPEYFDPAEVEQLTRAVLTRRRGSLHSQAPPWKLSRLSGGVGGRAGRSFLRAYLFAVDLAAREAQEDEVEVHASAADVFQEQLARLNPRDPGWAADLLTPLAFALGAGMPNYPVWIDVVRRLTGREIGYLDIEGILREAGEFVTESLSGPDSAGWRLQADEFASYLVGRQDASAAHAAFTEALLAALPADDEGDRPWSAADRYTRLNFAEHAVRAGLLDRHLADPGFLLGVDPLRLRRALTLAGTPQSHAVRDLCDLVHGRDWSDGCDLSRLSFLAAAHGQSELARRAARRSREWKPSWIGAEPTDAVTAVPGEGGGGHLVVSTQGGAVLVTELGADGLRCLVPGDDPVSAVGAGRLSGRPLVLVGRWSGRVTLHDLSSGGSSELTVLDDRVVACEVTDEGLLVATCRLWRRYLRGVGARPDVDSAGLVLSSVATAPDGGGRLTVGASADRVAVWDADGALLRTFPAPHRKALTRVAAHGGTVVTAGDDGTVHRCDLRGRDSRLLIRHGEQPVTSLRVLDGPGGPRVLTTGLDGSVVVAPLDGHGVGAATTLVDVGLQVKGGDLEDAGRLVLCTNLGTARIRL